MFKYNKDAETRDAYIFGKYEPEKYMGGVRRTQRNLNEADIKWLMDNRYLDPDDGQNYSPTAREIYDFIKEHPGFEAFGYVVCPERCDYRITLEGLECKVDVDEKTLKEFTEFAHRADEFDIAPCYAWWD